MALPLRSLAIFGGVVAVAVALTISSLSATTEMVAKVAAAAPSAAGPLKPSYVARMPDADADALNIAKSVPVVPKVATLQVTSAAPVAVEPVVAARPTYTHRVAASGANVRSGPAKASPQVFTLTQGSWVSAGENVRGWVLVTDEAGRQGWVYGDLLQAEVADVAVAAD